MKKYATLFLIVLLALSALSTIGGVSATKPTTPRTLDTPQLLAPPNEKYYAPEEPIVLSWTPVKHATTYVVTYQIYLYGYPWRSGTADSNGATSLNWDMGWGVNNVYKCVWSVQAVNTDERGAWAGATSAPSSERVFYP